MRILLASAVAIAPLMAASGAFAEVVISNARTTPIVTSKATGTAPDNVRLASGGSIAVKSGAAVTVDSNNSIDLDSGSSITMEKAEDGATGILVQGGTTGDVTIGGKIVITDDIDSPTDTDKDGDADGPFASGTDRYGIRITGGTGPRTGNVLMEAGSSIAVEGNNSYGISVESGLNGNLTNLGAVNVTGDNSKGISVTGAVNGNVNILGSVTAQGKDAVGVSIDAPVDGRTNIQGTITSTGYRYTSRPNKLPTTGTPYENTPYLERLDEDDLLQGGSAVSISADLSKGLVFDTGPSYKLGLEGDDDGNGVKNGDEDDDGDGIKNRDDPDRDGDGLPDVNEGTAKITTFGSAAAVQIGSTSNSVTLGVIGTGEEAYGLINRGEITGIGVYDDVHAHGLQIGVEGGQAVTVAGGIRNDGAISAAGTNGNATAILLKSGASTPTLINNGTITATSNSDRVGDVVGIQIENGASMTSLTNNSTIGVSSAGGKANATAVQDLSGTLTSITNNKSIFSSVSPNADRDPVTGKAVAIDVSANSTGVTIVQKGIPGTATDNDPDTDGDGVPNSAEPSIYGSIKLGSGADLLDVQNGVVVGDVHFGSGADKLSISGGSIVQGGIYTEDGKLSIDISNGTLDARQTGVTELSELNIGTKGDLVVTLDPENSTSGGFKVNGTANIADGAGLGVRFTSIIKDPTRFTIIDADTLNVGQIDGNTVQANSPYAFVVEHGTDVAAGEVFIDARRRTSEEAGMIKAEADAYDALYYGLADNEIIRNAILSQVSKEGFYDVYQQLMPDHSGGPLLSLASGVDAVTRALTGRNASAAPGETSAWLQEINFYADKDKTDTYGFRSEGFGVAGGVEKGTKAGAFGVTAAFTSSDLEDPESAAEEVLSANLLELGLYWRAQGQRWTTWARVGAGYASFEATRKLVTEGVNLTNKSDWNGFSLAAAGGASYEQNYGKFNVRPEVYAEYFSLSEDARSEKGGGDGFDLNIEERDGHLFSGVAAVNIGYGFGTNGWLRPEVRLGWRQNFSVDAGRTIARFASGGDAFTIDPASIEGGGAILGFRLNVGNELGMIGISGDAELLEDYVRYTLLLRASFRF